MPSPSSSAESSPSVIGKVAVILDAFTAEDHGVGFAELHRRTGLAKATLHRLTGELVAARLLDRVAGRFHLGAHLFELGMRASLERGLVEVATPYLEDLYDTRFQPRRHADAVRAAAPGIAAALSR